MKYRLIDWDKVNTFEDLKLIISELDPKAYEGSRAYEVLSHLFFDE